MGLDPEIKKGSNLEAKGGIGGRLNTRRDGYRKIGGDGFREITKAASSVFLFPICLT